MAKGRRGRHRFASLQCRQSPYPLPCHKQHDVSRKCSKALENKDWEDATCSVCMEYPHNAVLLLCSSYDKGCRPYMCGTSYRYSNCLDQYKNAYTKVTFPHLLDDKVTELACPLCRGQVKGWTVVEPARVFLNAKKRNCMQDGCTFIGMYKEIRKHVKAEHPTARPRQVDPVVEQKWRRFERERERDDVISTIRSSMPGARVFGDYVIEGNHSSDEEGEDGRNDEVGFDSNFVNVFFLLHAFEQAGNGELSRRLRRGSPETNHIHFSDHDDDSADDNDEDDSDDGDGISMVCYRAPAGRGRRGNGGGPR